MIMSTSTGKAMDMIMSIRTLTAMDIPIHIHRNLSDIYRIIERLDSKEEVKELAREHVSYCGGGGSESAWPSHR